MFQRTLQATLEQKLQQFPIVALTGPRQSGKTTLLQKYNAQYRYINLESPDQLQQIQ